MKRPIVVMITNQKGGVAKTTSTIELAHLFGEEYKVLCVDADPQGDLTTYLDVTKPQNTIVDVLNADILLEDAVTHVDTFDLLAGDIELSRADKLYGDPNDVYLLKEALDESDYDYIFLDSAPGRSVILYMEYIAADYIIGPAECDDGSINGLLRIETDLSRFRKHGQTNAKVLGTFLVKNEGTNMHKIAYELLDEEADQIGGRRFDTIIRKSVAAAEAKTVRQPLQTYKKYNNVSIDYRNLKKEIEQRIQVMEAQ